MCFAGGKLILVPLSILCLILASIGTECSLFFFSFSVTSLLLLCSLDETLNTNAFSLGYASGKDLNIGTNIIFVRWSFYY